MLVKLVESTPTENYEYLGNLSATPPWHSVFMSCGTVTQRTVIDGRVIRLGGKRKDIVPITLETHDGFETHCEATREMARTIGKFYDGPTLRFSGDGKWIRKDDGWELDKLVITNFEPLDGRGLAEVLAEIQNVPNAAWKQSDDPWRDLKEIRGDGDD